MSTACYAAYKAKDLLKPFSYEPKILGPWDVDIKITHCGVCHSDIHLIDGDWRKDIYPLVPGHEIIGIVTARGKNVTQLKKGDRVGVGWQSASCLKCEWCKKGEENLCNNYQATCVGKHGGFSQRIITDSRFAFAIPQALDSEHAAPLMCAGITVYSPLRRFVSPAMKVGVIGIGGLGHLALQFAHAMGASVTAFSTSAVKIKEAKELGADHFVLINDKKQMKEAASSLDFILSTVNVHLDWAAFLKILRPNGKLCLVGALPGDIKFPFDAILGDQKTVVGSVIGSRKMIKEMLSFAAKHKIKAKTQSVPLADVNVAIKKVKANEVRYRMVLTCN